MTEKGCDNCYYSFFDERAYPCSLCIRGVERTDQWQPSKKTKADRKTENSSEKPNNCEHITEDGVTCAKYPACDDCPDNPLNKVKGSKRLVKGSEVTTDCKTCKYGQDKHRYAHICNECGVGINNYTPQTERSE